MTGKTSANKGFKGNAGERIRVLASALRERLALAAKLGQSFSGKRDIYEALGYPKFLTYNHYQNRYLRDPIGKAVVDAPALECWADMPDVVEADEKDTTFELAWKDLVKALGLLDAFAAVDRLSGIGNYAVLLLGFDDNGGDLAAEVTTATNLLYATPYTQDAAPVTQYELDSKSPRFGLPLIYELKMVNGPNSSTSKSVHHSRILHVAEDCLQNKSFGTPRLEAVFNNLMNIELIACGSAEMFWRGALKGLAFLQDAETASFTDAEKEALVEEIDDYIHGLQRYLRLKGIDIKELTSDVADPSNHVAVQIDLIAAGRRIPKRILLGSERGELSSNQDERSWAKQMQNRQKRHCETNILWPFIERLVTVGVLPKPKKSLEVRWRDMLAPGARETADVGLVRAQAIAAYVNAIGAEDILPREIFYDKILGMSDDEIAIVEEMQGQLDQQANGHLPGGDG